MVLAVAPLPPLPALARDRLIDDAMYRWMGQIPQVLQTNHAQVELLTAATTAVALPTVPTVYLPDTVSLLDGFDYSLSTGILTVLRSGSYSISHLVNATPSAGNKNVYFYVEMAAGSGWAISRYTARTLELLNNAENQLVITASKYYQRGTRLRFYLWADATVTLRSYNLPGTVAGTATVPAYRMQYAGF